MYIFKNRNFKTQKCKWIQEEDDLKKKKKYVSKSKY